MASQRVFWSTLFDPYSWGVAAPFEAVANREWLYATFGIRSRLVRRQHIESAVGLVRLISMRTRRG